MDDVLKTFRNFLFRDFFYIVCGAVILRASREIGEVHLLPLSGDATMDGILLAGIAYAVGYMNQEIWSQTPFVTTARGSKYNRFLCSLYKRHTLRAWEDINRSLDSASLSADQHEAYQRIVNHKIVGAAMGSALLTSAILLGIASVLGGINWRLAGLAAGLLALGSVFVAAAWVKTMQQCGYLAALPMPDRAEEAAPAPAPAQAKPTAAAGAPQRAV